MMSGKLCSNVVNSLALLTAQPPQPPLHAGPLNVTTLVVTYVDHLQVSLP